MKSNQQFKNEALDALHGNWTKAVLITLIYVFIVGLFSGPVTYQSLEAQAYVKENVHNIRQMTTLIQDPAYQALQRRTNGTSAILTLAEILLIFPLAVGYANSIKKLVFEGDNNLLANMFHFSFGNYLHKVWGMLWMYILVALWSLLLIIPGFIKAFSYAMVPFILEEAPELSASDAVHRSRLMMHGHKFDLFWLWLSFIGWGILCLFTFGIGFFWLMPYIQASEAAFYREVKADYELNGGLA